MIKKIDFIKCVYPKPADTKTFLVHDSAAKMMHKINEIIDCINNKEEEIIKIIDFAIEATNMNSDYDVGLRNGLRSAKSFIDGKEPQYEACRKVETVEELSKKFKNTPICIIPEEAPSVVFYENSLGEWIPAEDKLPPLKKEVFVAVFNRKLKIYDLCISSLVEYNQCVDWANLEGYDKSVWSVTHWMPTPELPPIERTEK